MLRMEVGRGVEGAAPYSGKLMLRMEVGRGVEGIA